MAHAARHPFAPTVDPTRVDRCVEQLAREGCQAVHGIIERLERGEAYGCTAALSTAERRAVIGELKSVMALYQSCRAG
ncbi:MAG: hypothetical protein PHF72_09430 [Gammaproteobacteria bacterium]|nr:hypothetical protein [Gammaproteobacteria bacterium]